MADITLDLFEYANDAAAQAAYPTDADYGIDTSFITESGSDSRPIGYGNNWFEKLAQGIKVTVNITCTQVAVMLNKAGSPTDNVELRIETDSGGDPSGTLVHANATKSIAASGISTSFTWYTFVFPGTFSLSSGTQYHIVMQRSGAFSQTDVCYWRQYVSGGYADGVAKKLDSAWGTDGTRDFLFKVYNNVRVLQCYSESSIKQQGSYSLKGIAKITESLNDTLTRTIGTPIDLSDRNTIKFDIYALRTGAHIKVGIRDSGSVWTEKTYTVLASNTWETVTWDISGVSNANKDAIDRIKVTILNADADNTFYVDNMYAEEVAMNVLFFGSNF